MHYCALNICFGSRNVPSSGRIYLVCTNNAHKATDRQSVNLLQAVQVHEFLKLVRDVSPLKIIILLQPRYY